MMENWEMEKTMRMYDDANIFRDIVLRENRTIDTAAGGDISAKAEGKSFRRHYQIKVCILTAVMASALIFGGCGSSKKKDPDQVAKQTGMQAEIEFPEDSLAAGGGGMPDQNAGSSSVDAAAADTQKGTADTNGGSTFGNGTDQEHSFMAVEESSFGEDSGNGMEDRASDRQEPSSVSRESLYRENADGTPVNGWITDENGNTGYCDEEGYLLTGFQILDGFRYYFKEDGVMVTGAYTLEDGHRILFTDDGKQYLNSVAKMDGSYYCFDSDGYIVIGTDIPLPGGGTGMTDAEGRLYTGCHRFGNEVYTFTSLGKFRHKIDATKPMVALTYDDGPSQVNTGIILDTLKTYGGYATFFVCGRQIDICGDVLLQTEEAGCEIGNHTFNHYMLPNMDAAVTYQELSSTSSMVQMITNNRPSIMRPPTGSINEASRGNVAAVDDGYPMIIWSLDTVDWQHHDAATTIEKVLSGVKDGIIVLMHDMEHSSAIASQTIIPELINRGYSLVTVSELAAARGIKMEPGMDYYHFYPEEAQPVTEVLPGTPGPGDASQIPEPSDPGNAEASPAVITPVLTD